jgi:dipeptidyl aminopeptidase/acylaminoacyl peptidase
MITMNRILLLIFMGLSLTLSAQTAASDSPRLITARDLINFPSIRSLDLNVGADIIVYGLRETLAAENSYREHLYGMHLDGSGQRQLTYSTGSEWQGQLSPDGRHLAFLSNRPDTDGQKHTRLWVMPLDGGEARSLTPGKVSIVAFQWQADSKHIFFLSPANPPAPIKSWQDRQTKQGFDAHTKFVLRYTNHANFPSN